MLFPMWFDSLLRLGALLGLLFLAPGVPRPWPGAGGGPTPPAADRAVRDGRLLDLARPGARGWDRLPAADRAAVGRAKRRLAAADGPAARAAALEELHGAVAAKPLRYMAASDLAAALTELGRHREAADLYEDVAGLVPNDAMRRKAVRDRAAALAKAGAGTKPRNCCGR